MRHQINWIGFRKKQLQSIVILCSIYLEGLKTQEQLDQGSLCSGEDMTRTPLRHKHRTIPLVESVELFWYLHDVTTKNAIFWDVHSVDLVRADVSGRTCCLHHQVEKSANVVPMSRIPFTLIMEAILSSETSTLTRATRYHIPGDRILHSHPVRTSNFTDNCQCYNRVYFIKAWSDEPELWSSNKCTFVSEVLSEPTFVLDIWRLM
jgi:hypothetical protein